LNSDAPDDEAPSFRGDQEFDALNLGKDKGKLALVAASSADELLDACGEANKACPDDPILDLVGYGQGVTLSEKDPAGTPSATKALVRMVDGCLDDDDNERDFDPLVLPDGYEPRGMKANRVDCSRAVVPEAGTEDAGDGSTTDRPIQRDEDAGDAGPDATTETPDATTDTPDARPPRPRDGGRDATTAPSGTDGDEDGWDDSYIGTKNTTENPPIPPSTAKKSVSADCTASPGSTSAASSLPLFGLIAGALALTRRRRRS
jgi:MYXO-CTERM domain-containing protein